MFFLAFLMWTYLAGFRPAAYGTDVDKRQVVVSRRSHRYASFLRLEIRKFILQDCFKNQLVGTLAAEDSFLYNKKQL